jgi:hypothetical protein
VTQGFSRAYSGLDGVVLVDEQADRGEQAVGAVPVDEIHQGQQVVPGGVVPGVLAQFPPGWRRGRVRGARGDDLPSGHGRQWPGRARASPPPAKATRRLAARWCMTSAMAPMSVRHNGELSPQELADSVLARVSAGPNGLSARRVRRLAVSAGQPLPCWVLEWARR